MKRLNYIIMAIAAICALINGIIHLTTNTVHNGWEWPLIAFIWIGNSYICQRRIDRYEKNI